MSDAALNRLAAFAVGAMIILALAYVVAVLLGLLTLADWLAGHLRWV